MSNQEVDIPFETNDEPTFSSNLLGFSPKIADPAFATYQKKSILWSFTFAIGLAVIAMIAFPIYGNMSGEMDFPESLFYGIGIGGMFVLIALLQTLRKKLDKTWDGVVEFKDTFVQKELNDKNTHYHRIYIIKIKKDSGGKVKHKWRDLPGLYDYYNIGDRVRHHKGFYYYEKYDKSNDSQIMCMACMTFNDITGDACKRCKCPLLK